MRTLDQITAAHDRLVAILLGEVPNPFDDEDALRHLNAAAGVLCWVLRHDHNTTFAENLEKIDRFLSEQGYRLTARKDQ